MFEPPMSIVAAFFLAVHLRELRYQEWFEIESRLLAWD
jgi:hypothetical protein